MSHQLGFFDIEERYAFLSRSGDPLEQLNTVIDWEIFRCDLDKALKRSDRVKGGRPPFDAVLMFKVLIIQTLYNMSDDRAEFVINDRLSFMRFLGLSIGAKIPDAKTIWLFREKLSEAGALNDLLQSFDRHLRGSGYLAMEGQIVDATLVSSPKQRNNKEEKEQIKLGKSANEIWPEKSARAAQKDTDARWTVKYVKAKACAEGKKLCDIAIPTFGYKNHISIDKRYGFIRTQQVTDGATYEGRLIRRGLLDKNNTSSKVWGDTAYRSKQNEDFMQKNGFVSCIHRKKPKGKDMPKHIERGNQTRSKIRAKVEHVFAVQKEQMGIFVRTIGIQRASVKIGMANLAYNLKRYLWWEKSANMA